MPGGYQDEDQEQGECEINTNRCGCRNGVPANINTANGCKDDGQ